VRWATPLEQTHNRRSRTLDDDAELASDRLHHRT
jgi:hypothetical protein